MSQVARCIAITALFVTSAAMAAEPVVQASQVVAAVTQQAAPAGKRTAKRPQAVRTASPAKVAAATPEADFTLHWYN
ncbi:hypothetical protein [Roseateles paludis]|jgi:hypothetical protein|uniref:Uncharacterized protein n=1 Tax=Roseateles paludis TaxID=3145238 RepID=A0ABV0G0A5_9BURK